ncbi:MAG: NAD+ synthase [Thermoplasmatota archaeon]
MPSGSRSAAQPGSSAPPADTTRWSDTITLFLREYFAGPAAHTNGATLGLSGGVDSALVAALAARALGADQVVGVIMPHADSNPDDEKDAREVATALGIRTLRIEITALVEAVERAVPITLSQAARANAKARARMQILYALANTEQRLVLGTSNKSELLVGYFTKYGDGAADVYPIGDLYKTDVWTLAADLGVPTAVVEKPPTAGLWAGQTDEAELGISYHDLDRVLACFEAGLGPDGASQRTGVALTKVQEILERIRRAEHKRTSLVVPKLGFRTPGLDWRMARTLP